MTEDDDIPNYRFPNGSDEPDSADIARFEKDDFIQCPHCKKHNHPEAVTCRFCKLYLTDDPAANKKPLWLIITTLILLAMMIGYGASFFWGNEKHFDFHNWGK